MALSFRPALAAVLALAVVAGGCTRTPEARKADFLSKGNAFFEKQQYAAAVIEYKNAIQVDARFAEARLALARAYERLGDVRLALAEYVRAADLLPDDKDVQVRAAGYLLWARRFDEAKTRAEHVLQKDSRNLQAQVVLANALAGLRNVDQAVAEIEEAIRIDPARGATYTNLGVLEMTRGRLEAAEQAFQRTVELDPKWVPGRLAQANYYWATGRAAEAEAALRAAYDLEPANSLTNRALALLYVATNRASQAEPYVRSLASSGAAPFALADFLMLQNRPDEAIPELERLRKIEETKRDAGRRLAQAFAIRGALADADRVVGELLQDNAADSDALILNGQLLNNRGKKDDALAQFVKAASADPNSARAQFALGRSYASRGDVDQARQAFTEVLRLNPRAAAAQVELSRLELASGRVAASVQSARDAVRTEPRNLDAQLTLSRSLLASKDIAGALKIVQPLAVQYPDVSAVHAELGLIKNAAGDRAGARASFERALQLNPKSRQAIGALVGMDIAAGNITAAKSRLTAALAANDGDAELWMVAARSYGAMKDLPAAEQALKKALEIQPGLLPAYTMLGQLYLAQKRLAEAKREFQALAERQSRPVGALTILGVIAQMEADNNTAEDYFERAVELEPKAAVAANNLAWAYADRGDRLDLALQLALTAVQELPKSAEARDTLGWVQYKRKDASAAVSAFRETIALDPNNPIYHYHLGLALQQAENGPDAADSMRRALRLSGSARPEWAAEAQRIAGAAAPAGERTSRQH